MSTSPHLISLTANNWHGNCYIQGRDKLNQRTDMRTFTEEFAHLIRCIKEGSETGLLEKVAEEKLMKVAEVLDEEIAKRNEILD